MDQAEHKEAELLAKIKKNPSAEERRSLLEQLLTPYLEQITRWAVHMRGDTPAAADLAQDALVTICNRVDSFRGESRLSTWIYAVIRNQAARQGIRDARRRGLLAAWWQEGNTDHPGPELSTNPERTLLKRARAEEAGSIMRTELSLLEQKIFMMHYGQGMSLAVIQGKLGLANPSGARAYLLAAKRKLNRYRERARRIALARSERLERTSGVDDER